MLHMLVASVPWTSLLSVMSSFQFLPCWIFPKHLHCWPCPPYYSSHEPLSLSQVLSVFRPFFLSRSLRYQFWLTLIIRGDTERSHDCVSIQLAIVFSAMCPAICTAHFRNLKPVLSLELFFIGQRRKFPILGSTAVMGFAEKGSVGRTYKKVNAHRSLSRERCVRKTQRVIELLQRQRGVVATV